MIPSAAVAAKAHSTACRGCGMNGLEAVLDLGLMPHADGFVEPVDAPTEDPCWPLEVAFCPYCTLVQILESPPPSQLFGSDYHYRSGVIDGWLAHIETQAQRLIDELELGPDHRVIEIGSNDGSFLGAFKRAGIEVLGIDPAPGPVSYARAAGIPTHAAFFDKELSASLRAEGGAADLIIGTNVLAHTPDPNGLLAGVATLLKPKGLAMFEVPYVRDLISSRAFDTIYHEHHTYFSVSALEPLFARHGLVIRSVETVPVHGGSLRVFAGLDARQEASVAELRRQEISLGMDRLDYYRHFAHDCDDLVRQLRALLIPLKSRGARIAAYGAAAKGTILLNAAQLGRGLVDFVVDRNPEKQGRLVPRVRLPIRPPGALLEEQPEYVLILAWNWADEIMEQQQAFHRQGGRFVMPLPTPNVV